MTIIYGLQDPITKELRYVGKTACSLRERLHGHISETKYSKGHKQNWVKKVNPEIFEIDVVKDNEWKYWEMFYIAYYKMIGCRLLNITPGGDGTGVKGKKQSKETIKKRSDAMMGHIVTLETRNKLSVANIGRKESKETREKISKSKIGLSIPHTREWSDKINNANRGQKRTVEQKQTMALAQQKIQKRKKKICLICGGKHFAKDMCLECFNKSDYVKNWRKQYAKNNRDIMNKKTKIRNDKNRDKVTLDNRKRRKIREQKEKINKKLIANGSMCLIP
jgi:hypothetical protein